MNKNLELHLEKTKDSHQDEFFSVSALQLLGSRIEVEGSGQGQRDRHFRRRDEGVRGRVGVVAAGEVAVVRRHDRVLLALLHVLWKGRAKNEYLFSLLLLRWWRC